MPRKFTKTIVFACLLASAGCEPAFEPHLAPYPEEPNPFSDLTTVPIVVLARIQPNAVVPVGSPFQIKTSPFKIQQYKAAIQIEKVLKGEVPLGDATVNFFSVAGPVGGPRRLSLFGTVPYRALLLLRREKGRLRTIQDVNAHCVQAVISGIHVGWKPDPNKPLLQSIIDLLTTRGSGATDSQMLAAIFEPGPAKYADDTYTAKSLLRLTATEVPVIRAAACLQFREILVNSLPDSSASESNMSRELGIPSFTLAHWSELYSRRGTSSAEWTPESFLRNARPSADTGVKLCSDDAALGLTPAR